eukprot:CAMPEP_0197539194 /NCGR_PEP_ID=MMETSP1318-20131121/61919_1 /TAXON_ID=552666 /ORGANISM="Partenskyella glossopodia, Strain RCC365" /LENGTH=43 /DNA_ID= /DNA_START= /DNA_END= /DNA_ORIENTATION=
MKAASEALALYLVLSHGLQRDDVSVCFDYGAEECGEEERASDE